VAVSPLTTNVCITCHETSALSTSYIDGFHTIFLLWQQEGKGSCDVDIDQSAGSMVM